MEWFIPDYFKVWLESAQEEEKARMKQSRDEESSDVFMGFGRNKNSEDAEEAWEQWVEWVDSQIMGEDEKPPDTGD